MFRIVFMLMLMGTSVLAQNRNVESELSGDRELQAGKPREALILYQALLKEKPKDPRILVRASKACIDLALTERKEEKQIEWANRAVDYADRAVQAAPSLSTAHAQLAVSYGQKAVYVPAREKMDLSLLLKQHAEKALRLDSDNFVAMIVLGIWHREISNLNWALKLALRLVYDEVPTASFEEARRLLTRASRLQPGLILPGLELAKTLILMDEEDLAVKELRRISLLPPQDAGDPARLKEARELLRGLHS